MTTTESTNSREWEEQGWQLRPLSVPTHTETLVLNADRISDVAQGPGETTDDEPLFGAHLREALQAVRRLVR